MKRFILAAALTLAACNPGGSGPGPTPPTTPPTTPPEACPTPTPSERWVEDNNMGTAAGLPADFFTRLDTPATWANARAVTSAYVLRNSSMGAISDADLARMAILFRAVGITVAVNDGAATWAHHRLPALTFKGSIQKITRMLDAGLDVQHIAMQSTLSKPLPGPDGTTLEYTLATRYLDIAAYMKAISAAFPDRDFEFGLIDASPAMMPDTYESQWRGLQTHLRGEGLALDFVHMDLAMVHARKELRGLSWQGFKRVVGEARALGWETGFYLHEGPPGGADSDATWRRKMLDGIDSFLAVCGDMEHWVVASWYEWPQLSTPDTPTAATTFGVLTAMDQKLTAKGHPNPKD
ncbi:MAG: hypothetical protein V3W41_22550 [Planctomycetota bacterium]